MLKTTYTPKAAPRLDNTSTRRIYQAVRQAGNVSRADIVRTLDLTFPTILRVVANLIAAKVIKETETRRGGMGKSPTMLSIDPTHTYSLGVHWDREGASATLVNALGECVHRESFSRASLEEGLVGLLETCGVGSGKLVAVNLTAAAPGHVASDSLSRHLGVPITLSSTISSSVKAERYFGPDQELDTFVYYEAQQGELGAALGSTVLAYDGTFAALMALAGENPERLYMALKAATSLLQAEALIVGGLAERDLAKVQHQLPELPVKPASEQACDPSWAAASAPLFDALSV